MVRNETQEISAAYSSIFELEPQMIVSSSKDANHASSASAQADFHNIEQNIENEILNDSFGSENRLKETDAASTTLEDMLSSMKLDESDHCQDEDSKSNLDIISQCSDSENMLEDEMICSGDIGMQIMDRKRLRIFDQITTKS